MKASQVKLNQEVELNDTFEKRAWKDIQLSSAKGLYISDDTVFDGAFNSPFVKIKDDRGIEYLVYLKNLEIV